METRVRAGIVLVLPVLLIAVLAGCSDDGDERQQAVYTSAPKPTIRPAVPGYGQQYQHVPQQQYPRGSYQQQIPPQSPPSPQFELSDPGNPWAYRPRQRYTPPASQTAPSQSWTEPGGYGSFEQPRQQPDYRFGGYRPLDSDKPKKYRRDDRYAIPPERQPVYPYYSAPYPYGGAAPYGSYNPMGRPGADW